MNSKTFSCQGLVLKRTSVGETDRVVVLLTAEMGKLACVAKGVRKLKSSMRAALEPGNLVKIHCVKTKSMPLLTQATLLADTTSVRGSLVSIRHLTQLLEIVDRLFVEEELDTNIYHHVLHLRDSIVITHQSNGQVKLQLTALLEKLGYHTQGLTDSQTSVLDIVADISERPMRSFEYLSVRQEK